MVESCKLRFAIAMHIIATVIRVSGLSADCHCQVSSTKRFYAVKKMVLRRHTIKEYPSKTTIWCAMLCAKNNKCRSFNYDKINDICQLNDAPHVEYPNDLHHDESFNYYIVDQKSEFGAMWPSGTYGLPMPVDGCPTADGFNWETGYRFHDTDTSSPRNKWSEVLHLKGPYGLDDMYQHFCMKTVDRVGCSDIEWPQGEYCVFKYGEHCPMNMTCGSIYWIDEVVGNINRLNGTVPSGQYDQDTRINYCCMTSGSASQPIALPTGSPFYLFPYTAECQQVQGMTVTQEWFIWDCDGIQTAPVGSYPRYQPISNDHYIYYCYYQAT